MNKYTEKKIEQAAFEEEVNFELLVILERRPDIDEFFTRKDDEASEGCDYEC